MTQERCDLLKPYLDTFKRRFTLLDLGAGINPYVSRWISNNYDAVVVMVEKGPIQWGREEFGPNVIWIKRDISPLQLEKLQECEFFDVVLAFNFLHHFGEMDYLGAAVRVACMGSLVFVQVPHEDEEEKVPGFGKVLQGLNRYYQNRGTLIGETAQFPGHRPRPIYMVEDQLGKTLYRSNIDAAYGTANTLIADREDGIQGKVKGKEWKDWIAGINLWTYIRLGGGWPDRDTLVGMLQNFKLPEEQHGDITPWNFVLDGKDVHLVDGFEGWEFDDKENMKETIRKVKECLYI